MTVKEVVQHVGRTMKHQSVQLDENDQFTFDITTNHKKTNRLRKSSADIKALILH